MGLTQRGPVWWVGRLLGSYPAPRDPLPLSFLTPFPFTPHYGRESRRQAGPPSQFLVQPLPSWYPAKFSTWTVTDPSLFPAEEKSTREDPAPHRGSGAGTGTPNQQRTC